jgi:hypothetical protein
MVEQNTIPETGITFTLCNIINWKTVEWYVPPILNIKEKE